MSPDPICLSVAHTVAFLTGQFILELAVLQVRTDVLKTKLLAQLFAFSLLTKNRYRKCKVKFKINISSKSGFLVVVNLRAAIVQC